MAVESARAARSVWGEGLAGWRATRNSANSSTSDNDSSTNRKIIEHRRRDLGPSGKRGSAARPRHDFMFHTPLRGGRAVRRRCTGRPVGAEGDMSGD